jgi:hypothetical protein
MALDKTSLAAGIKSLTDDLFTDTTRTSIQARQAYADGLANLIDVYVKSGTLNVPGAGLVSASGGGAVTGSSVTGSIS